MTEDEVADIDEFEGEDEWDPEAALENDNTRREVVEALYMLSIPEEQIQALLEACNALPGKVARDLRRAGQKAKQPEFSYELLFLGYATVKTTGEYGGLTEDGTHLLMDCLEIILGVHMLEAYFHGAIMAFVKVNQVKLPKNEYVDLRATWVLVLGKILARRDEGKKTPTDEEALMGFLLAYAETSAMELKRGDDTSSGTTAGDG